MKFASQSLISLLFLFPSQITLTTTLYAADQGGDVLTGDVRLACEAILCLASSTRPGACSPSLSRYFGIRKKKFSRTIRARLNFLNLCPVSGQEGLKNQFARNAGRCDTESLVTQLNESGSTRISSNCLTYQAFLNSQLNANIELPIQADFCFQRFNPDSGDNEQACRTAFFNPLDPASTCQFVSNTESVPINQITDRDGNPLCT